MKVKILCVVIGMLNVLWVGVVLAQSEGQGMSLVKQAETIAKYADSKEDYQRAAQKYEEALKIGERVKSDKLIGICSYGLGIFQFRLGQYRKALEYYEQSLAIRKKTGDLKGEGAVLGSIGSVYSSLGQYPKALDFYEQSLAIRKKTGNVKGEGASLGSIGSVYSNLGQYPKALDFYEQSLAIRRKIGDVSGEGGNLSAIGWVYVNLGQYPKALEYYEQSLAIRKETGDVKGEGAVFNDIGIVYKDLGQYTRALDFYERSLEIHKKIGNVSGEGRNLNNIGGVYKNLGQYTKALDYYEQSLQIKRNIGDVKGEANTLNNIGEVCAAVGQYTKALDYYEQSLQIKRKIGDVNAEGVTLSNIGKLHALAGKTEYALNSIKQAIEISEKLGTPTSERKDTMANLYLDTGDFLQAENLIKDTDHTSTLGRLGLLKSDYPLAVKFYEKSVSASEKTGNSDALFTSYTGLAKSYEGMEDYPKAEECYEKAMKLVEEIRSGLLPSERKNFFDVKIGGFTRSDPARGLTRVRMKLNHADGSIDSSEVTRARAFSDHLSEISNTGSTGVPKETLEKEQSLVSKLAALKKELANTDKEKQSAKFEILDKDVRDAQTDLNAFIETLWKQNPAYAAVKYPRPVTLKESALKPEECALIFDVSAEGVGVKLIRNKSIAETFFKKWDQKDLENDVKKFREPFEKVRFKDFDPALAEDLYKKLLLRVLVDVPKGTPLIIIPDGILGLLPFEALVTGGKVNWNKGEFDVDNPEGLTFLEDEHPISYYQSITALTLARTMGNKDKPKDKLLVLADPVFAMKDQRAQKAGSTKLAERC